MGRMIEVSDFASLQLEIGHQVKFGYCSMLLPTEAWASYREIGGLEVVELDTGKRCYWAQQSVPDAVLDRMRSS